jgi:hypothetical protein
MKKSCKLNDIYFTEFKWCCVSEIMLFILLFQNTLYIPEWVLFMPVGLWLLLQISRYVLFFVWWLKEIKENEHEKN